MIHHSDWMDNEIPDKSINLIIADPPYFEVKGEFDFIWSDFSSYLQQVELWASECKRVLVDNGSLFWWGHAKKIAYSQIILDKYFNLENSLIWHKIDAQTNKNEPEHMRSFKPVTERILFYSNEVEKTGLQEIYDSPECFIPIKKYMRKERLKVMDHNNFKTIEEFNIYIRKVTDTSSVVDRHYFSDSQYCFPTAEIYQKLQTTGFFQRPYNNVENEHGSLKKEYEKLRQEYEALRRPFDLSLYNMNDIIPASQESHISKEYDHETIKPLTLTKKLIQTTTRKGDLVLIPFGGSGTEVDACIDTGRKYICYENNENHFNTILDREKKALSQPELF